MCKIHYVSRELTISSILFSLIPSSSLTVYAVLHLSLSESSNTPSLPFAQPSHHCPPSLLSPPPSSLPLLSSPPLKMTSTSLNLLCYSPLPVSPATRRRVLPALLVMMVNRSPSELGAYHSEDDTAVDTPSVPEHCEMGQTHFLPERGQRFERISCKVI